MGVKSGVVYLVWMVVTQKPFFFQAEDKWAKKGSGRKKSKMKKEGAKTASCLWDIENQPRLLSKTSLCIQCFRILIMLFQRKEGNGSSRRHLLRQQLCHCGLFGRNGVPPHQFVSCV